MRRVLACRPAAQNAGWATFLGEQNLEVLDIPLLRIADIENPENKQRIKDIILQLDSFDFLIFISQNAVKHAFEWIDDFWPQLPENLHIFAIGKKTAAAVQEICEQYYPSSDVQFDSAEGAMNSEVLLQNPALQALEGKKILIFKGLGGRQLLASTLSERGALVENCELYERSLPLESIESFVDLSLDTSRDIFVVFSGETLANLETSLQKNSYENKMYIPLVVPGQRIAELAREFGFNNVKVSENASEDAMWQTLQTLL